MELIEECGLPGCFKARVGFAVDIKCTAGELKAVFTTAYGILQISQHRVATHGVHVQIAANVCQLDQFRQATLIGPIKLAAILAQFGFDPGQSDCFVDVLFRCAGNARAVFDLEPQRLR